MTDDPEVELNPIQYVGGPRNGTRQTIKSLPPTIPDDGGLYRRSSHSADERCLRYVWEADARAEVAGRR